MILPAAIRCSSGSDSRKGARWIRSSGRRIDSSVGGRPERVSYGLPLEEEEEEEEEAGMRLSGLSELEDFEPACGCCDRPSAISPWHRLQMK